MKNILKNRLATNFFCTDDLKNGIKIRYKTTALKHRYIQLNNTNSKHCIILDIDYDTYPFCFDFLVPNLAIYNKNNSRCHLIFMLKTAIHWNKKSSVKAKNYYNSVEKALQQYFSADESYNGLMTKNPLHHDYRVFELNNELFELSDFAEYIDVSSIREKKIKIVNSGFGRNVTLFDTVRDFAYKNFNENNLSAKIEAFAIQTNNTFFEILGENEVNHITKSIINFMETKFKKQNSKKFLANQKIRSSLGVLAKQKKADDRKIQALKLRATGLKYKAISEELNCSEISIKRIFSK